MSQSQQNLPKDLPKAQPDMVPKADYKWWVNVSIALFITLLITLGFCGYLLNSCFGGCSEKCDASKKPSCPPGYTAICNQCSGHYYCGETKCTQNSDCKNQPLAKKEDRNFCKLDGSSGYCEQCTQDSDCPSSKAPLKCSEGWCSLCTTDSECTKEIYDAKADGKCTNNVCVFTECNGASKKPSDLADFWPYNTKAYADVTTCDVLPSS